MESDYRLDSFEIAAASSPRTNLVIAGCTMVQLRIRFKTRSRMQHPKNRIVGIALLTVLTVGGVIAPIVHQAAHDIAESSHETVPADHRHADDGSDSFSNGILPGPSTIHCALCAQHVVSVAFEARTVQVVPKDGRYFVRTVNLRSSNRSDRGQPRAPPARI